MSAASMRSSGRKETRMAQAQVIQAVETTWRHWRAFIAEKRDELVQRTADMSGQDDLLGTAPAAPRKANLPQTVRQELSQVLEMRRQQAQAQAESRARSAGQPAPDVDQVMGDLIVRIQAELNGEVLPTGKALVWFDGQLVEFDHRVVARGTTDDDYLGYSTSASRKRRQTYLALGAVVLGVLAVIVVIVVRSAGAAAGPATTTSPQAQIGQQNVALWDAQTMEIDGQRATINGASVGYPLLLCVPDSLKERIKPGATLRIHGAGNVRTYRLHDNTTTTPRDALVANCAKSPPQMLYSAEISDAQTSQPLDASRVRSVDVWSPDTNPGVIPPDRMQVDVHAVGTDVAQATLILADGTRWSPTRSSEEPDGLVHNYLVPLFKAEQIAGWEVRSGTDLPGLLSLNLPAPRSRASVLRQQLQVDATPAALVERDGQLTLVLTLTLQLDAKVPLKLLPTDLVVARPNEAPLSNVQWSPPTVEPDAPSTVTVAIPLANRQPPFDIALANWRARFRW